MACGFITFYGFPTTKKNLYRNKKFKLSLYTTKYYILTTIPLKTYKVHKYTVHILYITTCPSGACSWQLWYRGDFLNEFAFSFSTLGNLVDFCFSELRAPDIQPLLLNLTSRNLSTTSIHSEINLGPFQFRVWNLEPRSEQNWVRSRTQNMLIATRASLAA